MKRLSALSCLLLSLVSLSAAAFADNVLNDCERLNIIIHNNTGGTCKLVGEPSIIRGNPATDTITPYTINDKETSPTFTVNQSGYGPHVIIAYTCESCEPCDEDTTCGITKSIVLEMQQNFCLLKGAKITTKVTETQNIAAHATTTRGNFRDGIPGKVYWELD